MRAQGFDLFGLRLSEAGVIEGLAVANLTAQGAPLKPLGDLLRSLRDASAPPPSEQLLERAMGRAPNQLRPVVIGAVASGVVVAVLSGVGLALWLEDGSGVVIDPGAAMRAWTLLFGLALGMGCGGLS